MNQELNNAVSLLQQDLNSQTGSTRVVSVEALKLLLKEITSLEEKSFEKGLKTAQNIWEATKFGDTIEYKLKDAGIPATATPKT